MASRHSSSAGAATAAARAPIGGITLNGYLGDAAVLLAFNIDKAKTDRLAGFAIHCEFAGNATNKPANFFVNNRLAFDVKVTQGKKENVAQFQGSDQAPFQLFHYVHVPAMGMGQYTYTVSPAYFVQEGVTPVKLQLGAGVPVSVELKERTTGNLSLGFTRSYVSSQAYVNKFGNTPIRADNSIVFDPKTYDEAKYAWLGAEARKLLWEFLAECSSTKGAGLDIFAYDLDEPSFIKQVADLAKAGHAVRMYLDDFISKDAKTGKQSGHGLPTSPETKAAARLTAAGVQINRGHFKRFAHDKILIMKDADGKASKVLTGSANFSVRGLYVQANSILVFEDPAIAAQYEQVFEAVFTAAAKFQGSKLAAQWFKFPQNNPKCQVSYAPHPGSTKDQPFSMVDMAKSMAAAKSSVLFAVMEPTGGGPVMDALHKIETQKGIYAFGTIDKSGGIKLFAPGSANHGTVTSFDYLQKNVPAPFNAEVSGGQGQVIHHKFVVCDFNGDNPVVFCGSSNLAAGGEVSNGDNLLMITDKATATCYAVEAFRLYDHFHFRAVQSTSTSSEPLTLKKTTQEWLAPFFDESTAKCTMRQALA
jgi:hypothetical protein